MSEMVTVKILEHDTVNSRYLVAYRPEPGPTEVYSAVAWVRSYATSGQPKVGQVVEVPRKSLDLFGEIRTSVAKFLEVEA